MATIAAETQAVDYRQEYQDDIFVLTKPVHEVKTFDLPHSIWRTMFLAYAVFFGAITIATGRGLSALFMIVISAAYTIMYFGTAAALNAVTKAMCPPPPKGDVDTLTGPLSYGAAFAQILTVPIVIALFGCGIVIVRAVVAP